MTSWHLGDSHRQLKSGQWWWHNPGMESQSAARLVKTPQIRRTVWVMMSVALVGLGLVIVCWPRTIVLPAGVTLQDRQFAERRFRDLNGIAPSRVDLLSLVGELAVHDHRLQTAADCFHEIPSDHPRYGSAARLQEGQMWLRLNQADGAEQNFREFLSLASHPNRSTTPDQLSAARKWLNYILSVELRFEDRKQVLAEAHAQHAVDVFDSKQYFFPNLLIWNSSAGRRRLSEFLERDPQNRRLRLAHGRYLTVGGDLPAALAVLRELHQQDLQDSECAAAVLECLFEQADWVSFADVANSLPEYSAGESWLLTRMRAEWALHEQRWDDARRDFERLQSVDPASPWALMGLAKAFGQLKLPEQREQALARSLVLSRIRVSLSTVNEDAPEASQKLSEECRQIGLQDAADAFQWHAERIRQSHSGRPVD
ncbi:MAG: hypothetical protein JSS49_30410 [Planctomycetes bacterium]|nr:hypothetical protein [Planctomycetota bacterium]